MTSSLGFRGAAVSLVALALAGGLFATFDAPGSARADTKVAMTAERHHTITEVRRAFALEGLSFTSEERSGSLQDGVIILGTRKGRLAKPFSVAVYGPRATAYFSTTMHGYSARGGNVAVSYGGKDARFRARVEAAMANLNN